MHDVAHSWQRALVDALVEGADGAVGVPGVVSFRVQVAAATAVTLWQHAIMTWLDDESAEPDLRAHLEAPFAALRGVHD